MWQTIKANEDYQKDFSYVRKTRTARGGGKSAITSTTYPDMPAMFTQDPKTRIRDENGNRIHGMGQMIVEAEFFDDLGFEPDIDDFVKVNLLYYRIISVIDYSDFMHSGAYMLSVRREEYVN